VPTPARMPVVVQGTCMHAVLECHSLSVPDRSTSERSVQHLRVTLLHAGMSASCMSSSS
jgi:hypothetical protein